MRAALSQEIQLFFAKRFQTSNGFTAYPLGGAFCSCLEKVALYTFYPHRLPIAKLMKKPGQKNRFTMIKAARGKRDSIPVVACHSICALSCTQFNRWSIFERIHFEFYTKWPEFLTNPNVTIRVANLKLFPDLRMDMPLL
jgi:hypothetical protein